MYPCGKMFMTDSQEPGSLLDYMAKALGLCDMGNNIEKERLPSIVHDDLAQP